jgi:hypothetical protein
MSKKGKWDMSGTTYTICFVSVCLLALNRAYIVLWSWFTRWHSDENNKVDSCCVQVEKYKNLLYILSMVSSTGWIDLSNNKKANTSRSQFVSAILTMNIFAFFTPPRKLRRLFAVAAPVDLQSSQKESLHLPQKAVNLQSSQKTS